MAENKVAKGAKKTAARPGPHAEKAGAEAKLSAMVRKVAI